MFGSPSTLKLHMRFALLLMLGTSSALSYGDVSFQPRSEVSGYFQLQTATRSGALAAPRGLDLRRVRLQYLADLNPDVVFRSSMEFRAGSDRDNAQIRDFFLTWRPPGSDLSFQIGQFRHPISPESRVGVSSLEFPEKSLATRAILGGDRVKGALALYLLDDETTLVLGLFDSVTLGDPEHVGLNSRLLSDVAVGAGVRRREGDFSYGAHALFGDRGPRTDGELVLPRTERQLYVLEGEWRRAFVNELTLRAQAILGRDRPAGQAVTAQPLSGGYFRALYQVNDQWLISGQSQWFDPNTSVGGDGQTGYGLAVAFDPTAEIRLMLAHEWFQREGTRGDAQLTTLRMQVRF